MSLTPLASLRPRYGAVAGALLGAGIATWAAHHVYQLIESANGNGSPLAVAFALMFFVLAWNWGLAMTVHPVAPPAHHERSTQAAAERLANYRVTVAVPAYNEDPAALQASIRSILDGTRRPSRIHVVDDGSSSDYGQLPQLLADEARVAGVEFEWTRTENQGKRRAQTLAFRCDPRADVFVTVDSDSLLDRRALEEVLIPLHKERVTSVAGVVVALNSHKNLLARVTDLLFVAGQLTDRASQSRMGSVMVNSGPLAAYRASVIRPRLDDYVSETFFGRRVEFSDDSMLTTYAYLAGGQTVQQHSAIVFSLMPEKTGHHLRQYVRWMRGSTIRSFWRFKYLPLTSYAYWTHAVKWVQTVLSAFVIAALISRGTLLDSSTLPYLLIIPAALGYAQSSRYLLIRRSDQTFASQLLTVALAPVAILWAFTALRVVRWYGTATCRRTGWGTRANGVEVTLASDSPTRRFHRHGRGSTCPHMVAAAA